METCEKYTTALLGAINEVFDEESDHFISRLEELDATEFFMAILVATTHLLNTLTGEDKTLIETTYVLNTLAVQKAIKIAKEDASK